MRMCANAPLTLSWIQQAGGREARGFFKDVQEGFGMGHNALATSCPQTTPFVRSGAASPWAGKRG